MQISIYVINNMPEPGHNLAAGACMRRTQLSPCIISVLGQSVPTGMPCQHDIFSCWSTYIQIFFGNIYNIVTTTVTNRTGVELVSNIYVIKPTCCQNNPAESFLWMHLHQFQYLLPIATSMATLHQQVRYEVVVCSRKWDIRAVFFVGMMGGHRQDMLGWNNFHSASSRYFIHWNLTNTSTSKTVGPLYTYLWIFLNIYLHQTSQSHSTITNTRVKFFA